MTIDRYRRDAETFSAETIRNHTRQNPDPFAIAAMAQCLVDIEWSGSSVHPECPSCRAHESRGHEKECRLEAALVAARSWEGITGKLERQRVSDVQRRYRESVERRSGITDRRIREPEYALGHDRRSGAGPRRASDAEAMSRALLDPRAGAVP